MGWLDYGFKMYSPEIGRWSVIDALSEKHKAISPYAYVLNNPIILIDPLGLDTLKAVEVTATRLNVDPDWTSFIQELGQDGYQNFVQNYYQNKLNAYRTPFAASVYGLNSDGEVMIPDNILAREWEETEEEALPALAAIWAMDQTGEDPSSVSYLFNPIAQASFLSKYVMTGISPEEASKLVKGLGVQLAVAWVGQLSIPNSAGLSVKELRGSGGGVNGFTVSNGKGWGAKPRVDVHPLKYPSKAGNRLSLPKILKNGKIPIPHYHRGKGNALRLHRPWEARPGKGVLNRF